MGENEDDYTYHAWLWSGALLLLGEVAGARQRNELIIRDLVNRHFVITGASKGGLGYEASLLLVNRGATVTIGVRDPSTFHKNNKDIIVKELDLTSVLSIREFAGSIDDCHVLINNAAIMSSNEVDLIPLSPSSNSTKVLERTLFTNFIGPHLLTQLLLPTLIASSKSSKQESRIINVGSRLEKKASSGEDVIKSLSSSITPTTQTKYNPFTAYANSKLCSLLTTAELTRVLATANPSNSVTANVVTPGMCNTNLARTSNTNPLLLYLTAPFRWLVLRSAKQGEVKIGWLIFLYCYLFMVQNRGSKLLLLKLNNYACVGGESVVYAATSFTLNGVSGKFISEFGEIIEPSKKANDAELAKKIWNETEKLLSKYK